MLFGEISEIFSKHLFLRNTSNVCFWEGSGIPELENRVKKRITSYELWRHKTELIQIVMS